MHVTVTCRVTILDHHKTAVEAFASLPAGRIPKNLRINLDMNKSGCTMALDYFLPQVGLSSVRGAAHACTCDAP